ncbi:hypothetical protein Q785_07960 [Ornithobacterium rhinotracheale ORT-UMN 88]|uniref:hypothetical protein n=1 Tax=Ornithobacterium rhinotracheale TaxID=28251 RepID=UPI0004F783F1|nr:hypothetical protein [Ornithobacterium rhinotracheale]AIP98772.1 hypothetical protein Q785_02100 [Ornithobacterium rhinotracheale ORT-UMN 88]AIP99340.1 hypothetical protein Q785_06045 [Ornithobacterium rhinotracheale ORT-UMN 88]AIP99616.1 hypothetical protein Q785_07960 [Ornithobacterium rhinotracheale ORT-UMN 88]UVD86198.1 hypothetical protein NV236_05790 [Ornithobacterium rhinotracheale]UVD86539.1 hypothetical protein NV236_07635 [Ornithobacterium rhinotracheale]
MTQREKRKIKFWLFIFLVIFILFWFTEKKSIKEKITTGDGSVIPLDLEKLKAPAPILPKVDKPKFDSVFAKGGSAVINEKAFNQKVENMMQAQKQKGKIPVKSDVVKKLQEEQANDFCSECEEEKRREQEERKRKEQEEIRKKLLEKKNNCNQISEVPVKFHYDCEEPEKVKITGMGGLALFRMPSTGHCRVLNLYGETTRVIQSYNDGEKEYLVEHGHYIDLLGYVKAQVSNIQLDSNGGFEQLS